MYIVHQSHSAIKTMYMSKSQTCTIKIYNEKPDLQVKKLSDSIVLQYKCNAVNHSS